MSNSKRKAHCGKVKHATLRAAQIALQRTRSSTNKRDPIVTGLSVYKCPFCDGWHVGRSQKKGINWDKVEALDRELRKRCAEATYSKIASANSNATENVALELGNMAEWTGLEPATPGVTGRSMK